MNKLPISIDQQAELINAKIRSEIDNLDLLSAVDDSSHAYKISEERLATYKAILESLKELKEIKAPTKEMDGALPLVLYFGNKADREGFIELFKEAMPDAIAKKVE